MAYTPTTWKTGDKVTAEKLNNIEDGIVNNALPSVTPEDDGKVLGVENGAWTVINSVQPSGGNVFVVNYTYDDEQEKFITDKTLEEALAAWESGMVLVLVCDGADLPMAVQPDNNRISWLHFDYGTSEIVADWYVWTVSGITRTTAYWAVTPDN